MIIVAIIRKHGNFYEVFLKSFKAHFLKTCYFAIEISTTKKTAPKAVLIPKCGSANPEPQKTFF